MKHKIIRLKNSINITFEDGSNLTSTKCNDEMMNDIKENINNEDMIRAIVEPLAEGARQDYEDKRDILDNIENSKHITVSGSSFYLKSVSELSMPIDLAVAFHKAEEAGDEDLIETYTNFWTLCSLNPDSRARTNLFWFLDRYKLTISKSGLFVAYRNLKLYKDAEDKMDRVYTDGYTGTFRIKLGEKVTMARSACDATQENTCSRGLHAASKDWLEAQGSNYFGNTSLMVLIDPSKVVAVPPMDSYGKLRTCEYLPCDLVEWKDGKIIDKRMNGFEENFFTDISYEGEINNKEDKKFELEIPKIPELDRTRVIGNLDKIRRQISNRVC